MGEVNITVNGRSFKLGCDDGEEQHLLTLAGHIGKHVEKLRQSLGKTADEQLFLMAGLMVCDELWDARDRLDQCEKALKQAQRAPSPLASPLKGTKASGAPERAMTVGQKIAAAQKPAPSPVKPAAAPLATPAQKTNSKTS